MSTINYNLNHKGVKIIDARDAWIKGKNGKLCLNPKYHFIGRMEMSMPNMVFKTTQGRKPSYYDDVSNLNKPVKRQIVKYFYDDNGKRNKKSVVYFGVEKKQ